MNRCIECFYYDVDKDEEPCSICKNLGHGEINKFKPAIHSERSDDPCYGCFYDYRNYEGAEKDKVMMCDSCYRHSTRVNYIKEAYYPFSCENCKHKLEDAYASCTVCSECDRYSNFEAEFPKEEPKPKKTGPIFIEDDIEQEQVKNEIESAIMNLSLEINPCKSCACFESADETCNECCFNYVSKFKLRGAK